jgi:tetratricopeptide (TPR) repeat protein
VAQVKRCAALLFLLLTMQISAAGPIVPAAGLRAEGQQRWQEALKVYQRELAADPLRADLWLRMADIYSVLKQPADVARATAEAARLRPNDAALQFRLSQAHAVNGQPAAALAAVSHALRLAPGNPVYLEAQGELALWNGDSATAEASYRDLLAQAPDHPAAQRKRAQILQRDGRLDDAVDAYAGHIQLHPGDHPALLEQAQAETFRGNYAAAQRLLERYRGAAGEDSAYLRARAMFLADAGRPQAALSALQPLLGQDSGDYDLQLAQAKALHTHRESAAARRQLDVLDALGPERPETAGARLLVETPRRAHVSAAADYYADSIPLSILRIQLKGQTALHGRSRLSLEFDDWTLRTDPGTGYETPAGELQQSIQDAWLKLDYQAAPALLLNVGVGGARFPDDQSHTLTQFGLRFWPSDSLSMGLSRQRMPVVVSPRSAALAVQRDENRLDVTWQPGYGGTLDFSAAADHYSDGNRRHEMAVAPRLAVLRRERYNLDLGVSAHWLSFDDAPGNGYYAPGDFRRFWGMAYGYWKGGENLGVSAVLGLGPERDRELDSGYRLGGNLYTEATLGIYQDWQVRAYAGYGSRLDAARYQTGTPHASSIGLQLIRRF